VSEEWDRSWLWGEGALGPCRAGPSPSATPHTPSRTPPREKALFSPLILAVAVQCGCHGLSSGVPPSPGAPPHGEHPLVTPACRERRRSIRAAALAVQEGAPAREITVGINPVNN